MCCLDKDNKAAIVTESLDSSKFSELKCKTNKVSDINKIPTANELPESQKTTRKIKFCNEVKVKDSPNRSVRVHKLCDRESSSEMGYTIEDVDEKSSPENEPIKIKKCVQLPRERVIDMSPEDQKQWELEEMLKPIDLEKAQVHIDPSPFQLVERTSILKVHSLFSMVGINHAYVTKIGRLVGVVGLKELRKAIEDINSNSFVAPSRDDEVDLDTKPAVEKPLLSPSAAQASDKAVDMTITSMDSALSNSDNCSDIEMESMSKSMDKPAVTLTMPTAQESTTITDTKNTEKS